MKEWGKKEGLDGGPPNYNELWENLNQPTGEVQSKDFSLEFSGIWQECLNFNKTVISQFMGAAEKDSSSWT